MDGLFFYWILWIAWVFTMFFIPKTVPVRFSLLFHFLAIMILARYKLTVFSCSMQLSGLYMYGVVCVAIRKWSLMNLLRLVINSILIALAYAIFQLFVLLDPIWVMIKPEYLLCLFMNYLVLLLVKDWKNRVSVLLLGMLQGDLLYGGLLTYQSLPYISLSFTWHDATALVLVVQLLWTFLELMSKQMYRQTQNRYFLENKEV